MVEYGPTQEIFEDLWEQHTMEYIRVQLRLATLRPTACETPCSKLMDMGAGARRLRSGAACDGPSVRSLTEKI